MSAEIGSVETETGEDMSVELEMAAKGVAGLNIVPTESQENLPSDEGDAADFLLSNSKYHDCFLTVGNPEWEKVETIGVTSVELIAHSPVFREMLENYKQTDLPQAKIMITDVSPATFKLMLRFVYGGKLPKMTAFETAGLALCADKYKIPRLVQKSLKRLVPSGAEDVFPALICVTFANFPDLEVQVSKIIQQETDKIVQNADFLKLDENCVLFMLKQDTLNIDEPELWKHVVRWAEHQAEMNPDRTVRDCLDKILGHVRFLTFTVEEIFEHVLLTKVLTSDEYMDLSFAIIKKQTLESPSLCIIQERRNLYKEEIAIPAVGDAEEKTKDLRGLRPGTVTFSRYGKFKISDYCELNRMGYGCDSTFSIKPTDFIEITAFICQGMDKNVLSILSILSKRRDDQNNTLSYLFSCFITVTKTSNDGEVIEREVEVWDTGFCFRKIRLSISHHLLGEGKDPLILSPDATWTFTLEFSFAHPTYKLLNVASNGSVDIDSPLKMDNIIFKSDRCSVLEIVYKRR